MADALSIATGITGLLPLVKEGFVLVTDVFVADRKSRFYLGRVELQKTILQAWEENWIDPHGLIFPTLEAFARDKPLLARGVLQQLVLLLRTFTDPEKLKVRYGLSVEKLGTLQRLDDLLAEMKYASAYLYMMDNRFSSKDIAMFEDSRLKHMSLLQNIRYTLLGTDSEMEELIRRLEEFNRNLQLFGTRTTRENVGRKVLELVVKDVAKDIDKTKRLEEAATYETKHSIDHETKGKYDDVAKFANFCMAIHTANSDMPRRKIFSSNDFSFDAPYSLGPNATLARLFDYPTKYQARLVLVEWIRVPKGTPISETLDETKVTWYILHAEKTQKLLLPATIGLIYDETNPRTIGMVFQLPPHIRGNLPTKPLIGQPGILDSRVVRSPKTIAAQRMPTSLRDLILKKEPKGLDLGIRFKLAKQLLDAVHLMHTCRFTHRNIRPDNILLFPSSMPQGDPDPTTLDYANPLLFGFHDESLTIQLSPDGGPTWTQPEGLKPILKNANRKPAREVVIECYTHPERRIAEQRGRRSIKAYHRQYDLYSVGCVLLELGVWETLDNVCGRDIAMRAASAGEGSRVEVVADEVWKDAETVRKVAKGLDSITGSIYADVTRKCLSLSPVSGDILEFERGLAATLAQIAA
ncbi:hypothetical protein VTI74DRAFT_5546 [Chaetomium olivicolor]